MKVKHNQSFWVGILILSLLPAIASAESTDPVPPVTSNAQTDGKSLVEQAEAALDHEELDKAVKLYHQAAELNYTPAQVYMGQMADAGQFYDEAVGWFLMAASQGDAAGQFNLSRMYVSGNGIEKDMSKALYWIRRSAAKNYLPSVKLLAEAYRTGWEGQLEINPEQAQNWEAKAARLEAIERKIADDKIKAYTTTVQKQQQEEAAKKAKK